MSRSSLLIAAALIAGVRGSNSTVYIIRHGEKTWGGGCLNIQGQERANHLPALFGKGGKFQTPSALFANKYNAQPDCERCWLTVQSLAQALKLPVDFEHGYPKELGGNEDAARAIRLAATMHSVILASWEHHNIQYLTADLGVPKSQIPSWPHDDFDTVYVVTLDASSVRTPLPHTRLRYGRLKV